MKNKLLNIIRIVVSLLLLILLFKKMNMGEIIPILTKININLFLLSFLGYILLLLFSALRWWWLLGAQDVRLPFIRVFAYYLIGMFFNNFLPPTIGGGAVRAIYAGADTGKKRESFASMSCELVVGFIGLFIFVTILLLFYLGTGEGKILFFIFLLGTIVLTSLFYLLISPKITEKLEKPIKKLKLWGIGEKLYNLYIAVSLYRGKILTILGVIFLSFGVQTAIGIENFFIGRAIGLEEITLLSYIVFPSIISVITILPSIGGLGIRELSYVYFFNLLGISNEAAFSLSILFYLVGIVGSLPGAIIFATMKKYNKPLIVNRKS